MNWRYYEFVYKMKLKETHYYMNICILYAYIQRKKNPRKGSIEKTIYAKWFLCFLNRNKVYIVSYYGAYIHSFLFALTKYILSWCEIQFEIMKGAN